jgi:signal transduction histidine kinase
MITDVPVTLDHVSDRPVRRSGGYLGLWRTVPRELGFLVLGLPIALATVGVLWPLFWFGVGTIVIVVGLFVVVAALYVARAFGTVELVRLGWAGRPPIPRPDWRRPDTPGSFWRSALAPWANLHYWLYLIHGLVVTIAISTVSWGIMIGWVAMAGGGLTYWIWAGFTDHGQTLYPSVWLYENYFHGQPAPFGHMAGDIVLYLVVGALFLVTLPFVTRALVLMHYGLARLMLAEWGWERLGRQVVELEGRRGAAVTAEDRSLRRLERDIHDGPQQRLVRLQMDLASAQRRLDDDPTASRELIEGAQTLAQEALDELRSLSRGFAPPILTDRGLATALESLAARSTVPVEMRVDLAPGYRAAPEVERSLYFTAAELLANVAKHSGAKSARVALSSVADGAALRLTVVDDGTGGAVTAPGHGLSGLDERLRGLGGSLDVESPAGGPTMIVAEVPAPPILEP